MNIITIDRIKLCLIYFVNKFNKLSQRGYKRGESKSGR
jgi:hypothetical protein